MNDDIRPPGCFDYEQVWKFRHEDRDAAKAWWSAMAEKHGVEHCSISLADDPGDWIEVVVFYE